MASNGDARLREMEKGMGMGTDNGASETGGRVSPDTVMEDDSTSHDAGSVEASDFSAFAGPTNPRFGLGARPLTQDDVLPLGQQWSTSYLGQEGRGGRGGGRRGGGRRDRGHRGGFGQGGFGPGGAGGGFPAAQANPYSNPGQQVPQPNQATHGIGGSLGGYMPAQQGGQKRRRDNDDDESNKRLALDVLNPTAGQDRYRKGGASLRYDERMGAMTDAQLASGKKNEKNWYTDLQNAAPGTTGSLTDAPPLTRDGKVTKAQKDALMALNAGHQAAARRSSSHKVFSTHTPVDTSLAAKTNLSFNPVGSASALHSGKLAMEIHRQRMNKRRAASSIMGPPGQFGAYGTVSREPSIAGQESGTNPLRPIEVDKLPDKQPEQFDLTGEPEPELRVWFATFDT